MNHKKNDQKEAYGTASLFTLPHNSKDPWKDDDKDVISQWYDEICYVIVSSETIHQQRFFKKKN